MNIIPPAPTLVDTRYNKAISALTYGLHCLVMDPRTSHLHDCILTIHEEYINILHLIISQKVSYLLKLHEIYNITDNEFSIESKLKERNIHNYLILYTQSLDSFTFAFHTEQEKQICQIGIILFVREAKLYYDRLNQFDPFKAEAMMTFLEADKDGGNLLDIEEIESILTEMKIYRDSEEILKDIAQINKILYDYEKLKKPNGMKNQELNELGFQYLLRYYTVKEDIAKIFKQYCSQYRIQNRSNKVNIVSIVRYNQNPIMSAAQLRQFYDKVLFLEVDEDYCKRLIQSFPVYDGEGKEKAQKQELISFNNFCSLLSSSNNSAFCEEKKEQHHNMTLPLTDYYIYSDLTDYSLKNDEGESKINYELSLKRGIRCLLFRLKETKNQEPMVSVCGQLQSLEELMKTIASKAFEFNNFPIILKFKYQQISKAALDRTAAIITDILEDQLYTPPPNYQEHETLPSPSELMKKVLIMATVNPKLFKYKEHPDQSVNFFKIVSLFGSKFDLERKGQFAWNFVAVDDSKVVKLQNVEEEGFSNYTKRLMVKVGPTPEKGTEVNKKSSVYLRMGIQLIGLTFKNINEQNYFMQSLFLQNGGAKSGYLLKPSWMCYKNPKNLYAKNFDTPIMNLSLKILSGQNCIINELPKNQRLFVEVSLRGTKRGEEVNKIAVSEPQHPGYYVQFGLQCEFTVYCMDLETVLFLVRGEVSKTIVSGRAVPVRHLKQGLRPVYLMGNNFKESVSSYLFIHCEHKQPHRKPGMHLQSKV